MSRMITETCDGCGAEVLGAPRDLDEIPGWLVLSADRDEDSAEVSLCSKCGDEEDKIGRAVLNRLKPRNRRRKPNPLAELAVSMMDRMAEIPGQSPELLAMVAEWKKTMADALGGVP